MTHTLEASSIRLNFGLRNILNDIYVKCQTGKITGLLGRNGQGKTCLLHVIYGHLQPTDKSIRFDNISVSLPYKNLGFISYLPQFNFIPSALSLKRIFSDFNISFSEFEGFFPEFNTLYKLAVGKLSGGQRRLVEVYCIIKSKSKFSLLDEPFTHLMPMQIEKIIELLLIEKRHKGFLITDHLYKHVVELSDNLYVLTNGKTNLIKNIEDIERLGYARM